MLHPKNTTGSLAALIKMPLYSRHFPEVAQPGYEPVVKVPKKKKKKKKVTLISKNQNESLQAWVVLQFPESQFYLNPIINLKFYSGIPI